MKFSCWQCGYATDDNVEYVRHMAAKNCILHIVSRVIDLETRLNNAEIKIMNLQLVQGRKPHVYK